MNDLKDGWLTNTAAINQLFIYIIYVIGLGIFMTDSKKELFAETVAIKQFSFYIGTNTNRADEGIYFCRFNSESGQFTVPQLAIEALNPNFIAFHSSGNFLYAVGDSNSPEPQKSGCVNAFSICKRTGKLSLINQVPSCGQTPCHVILDKAGKYAFISNYSTGNLAVLPVETDGRLSEAPTNIQHAGSSIDSGRQQGPHIHSITLDADNRFAFVADLGLDKIMIYRFNPDSGILAPNDNMPYISIKPGSGPRHFAFHPAGNYAYIINEMSNTITAFSYDISSGVLSEIQTILTIPNGYTGDTYTSEIQVHPSGKYLYGSNRGHDSIAVFKIDNKGTLALVDIQSCGGQWPRHFCIDPTGNWMLVGNEKSDQVNLFSIDSETGKLTQTESFISVPSPVCIKFLPI
jgi:6-phosphogluconolactonase